MEEEINKAYELLEEIAKSDLTTVNQDDLKDFLIGLYRDVIGGPNTHTHNERAEKLK